MQPFETNSEQKATDVASVDREEAAAPEDATPGPGAVEQQAVIMRRARNRTAQRNYKARQKDKLSTLIAEVQVKRSQVAALLRTNLNLRLRERVLERAIGGGVQHLMVLTMQVDTASNQQCQIQHDRQYQHQENTCPIGKGAYANGASATPLGLDQQQTQEGALHQPVNPTPLLALGPSSMQLAGGQPLAAGDAAPAAARAQLAAAARQPDGRSPAAVPPRLEARPRSLQDDLSDALREFGIRFKEFVAAHTAAQSYRGRSAKGQAEEAREHCLQLCKALHSFVRHQHLEDPTLRYRLKCTNLATLEREEPPEGHWLMVLTQARAFDRVALEVKLEMRELFLLYERQMAKLRASQVAVVEELEKLSLSPLEGGTEEWQLCYEQLLGSLESNWHHEQSVTNVLAWDTYRLVSFDLFTDMVAASYPFWIDPWACMAIVAHSMSDDAR